MAESQTNDNNTCVVCFKNVLYYSIGECDHPVCFECSTRMRVLCLQNECPICRQALSRVVFTDTVQPYKELRTRVFSDRLFERQFKIGFCSEEIKQAYETLLENRCKICSNIPLFRTFSQLSDHMRKVHERYYCDLCVKHLMIFTSERKCYTRQELAHHRRKGDVDDTSHRGHPLCEFCEQRFMDADELYRHLRKEHLYCHLCDADGKNLYYASHSALAHHFRTDHFLCEEGECAGNHLTAVFRTEIDLKAHKATVHGKGLTRGAARQARTLELQFNITPHSAQLVHRPARDRDRDRREEEPTPPPPPPQSNIDTRSDEQFPRLSTVPPSTHLVRPALSRPYKGVDGLARNERNFPALGGSETGPASRAGSAPPRPAAAPAPAATVLRNSKPAVSIQLHSQPASASNFRLTQTSGNRISIPRRPLSDDDFPSLGTESTAPPVQPPKVGTINSQEMQALRCNQSGQAAAATAPSRKQQLNAEAFPALGHAPAAGPPAAPATPALWITVSKEKGKKVLKPEPPPQPREPAFNPVADFPTLPVNTKAKSKKTPVVQQYQPPSYQKPPSNPHPPPTPAPDPKPANKKEKKKQNNILKKENSEPPTPTYVNGYDKFTNKQIKEAYNAAINEESKGPQIDKKIKTIEETTSLTVNVEKRRNAGNGDFSLAAQDYPPLSARSANTVPAPVPAAYAQLKQGKKEKVANGSVPPGFSGAMRLACDGMTFTNSAGQTFPAAPHAFIPPPDFEQRNRALVHAFTSALGSPAALHDFKVASRAFRDSIIGADEFYDHLERALGPKLESVFPDLVALLPDIAKQQELVAGRDIHFKLEVCSTCGQLLAPDDRIAHDTAHWPPLSSR